jgi:hypothetical protein
MIEYNTGNIACKTGMLQQIYKRIRKMREHYDKSKKKTKAIEPPYPMGFAHGGKVATKK